MHHPANERLGLTAVVVAALANLQPGIDPVFLTLLSSAHGVAPEFHGWVVSATQAGMAGGGVLVWRAGTRLPQSSFAFAAVVALLAAVATTQVAHFTTLLAIRAVYGAACGVLYTQAMSVAAVSRPHRAYAAVFLIQLMLATLAALILTALADFWGAPAALAILAAVPLCALMLMLSTRGDPGACLRPREEQRAATGATSLRAWAAAGASLLFICSTMLVWTFSGALAVEAGISEGTIGTAVALGSLAGAGTALLVMRERPVLPPALTGVLAGLTLLSPVAATRVGASGAFIAAIVLLNIGSTAIIVRSSGLASAQGEGGLFRRFVACTHPLGMVLGPLIGSFATIALGRTGLLLAAVLIITAACLLLGASQARRPIGRRRRARHESLDELLTPVQNLERSTGGLG